MRAFVLIRDEDATGVSGTGVVAEGCEFSDGRIAMRWMVGPLHALETNSTVLWDDMENLIRVHGHSGRAWVQYATDIVWPPANEGRPGHWEQSPLRWVEQRDLAEEAEQ